MARMFADIVVGKTGAAELVFLVSAILAWVAAAVHAAGRDALGALKLAAIGGIAFGLFLL